MSASTRTPTGGTISIKDCLITMGNAGTSTQNMVILSSYAADGYLGLTEIYGGPITSAPYKMTDYYDIQGIIDYTLEYDNIDPLTGSITTTIYELTTGNDYNLGVQTDSNPTANWPMGSVPLSGGCTTPSGIQWHYRYVAVVIEVTNFRMSNMDVFLDTNLIGHIPPGTGAYLFDNAGAGYLSSYASPLVIKLQGI